MTNDKEEKQTRNRGVKLSAATVRALARARNMDTLAKFELAMLKFLKVPDGQSNTTAHNAWYGKPMDKSRAESVAQFFGLGKDYFLLQEPPEPKWVELLNTHALRSDFLEFIPAQTALDLVDFGFHNPEGLNGIDLTTRWRLAFDGNPGEQIFVLMRSTNKFVLVAPLNAEADFNNRFEGETLLYPQRFIGFAQNEGIGWRELIAIKAEKIPFSPRHPDEGFMVSHDELERFSHQLIEQNEQIEVSRFAFVLV